MSLARFLLLPTIAVSGYSLRPRSLACDSTPFTGLNQRVKVSTTKPLIDPQQFATGSVLGIAAGLIFRRLGKIFFVIVGGSYFLFRALSTSGQTILRIPGIEGSTSIPWAKMKRFLLNKTATEETMEGATEVGESRIVAFMTRDVTFKASFLATFLIGLVNT